MLDKKGKTKPNGVEVSHHSSYFRKKIDTINKTKKQQAFNKSVITTRSNKTDKVN